MCPARDVGDDKISVVALLTSPYQHRDPQPCGLLRLLGSPPLPSLHWTSRSSCEDAQVRVAAALMSRFHNICVNLVSGSNTGRRGGAPAGPLSPHTAAATRDKADATRQVAALLGRATTIIRAVERALHAYPEGQWLRFPAWQFHDGRPLPGCRRRTGPARQDLGQRSTTPCGQRVELGPESSGLNCPTSTGCAPARRRPDTTWQCCSPPHRTACRHYPGARHHWPERRSTPYSQHLHPRSVRDRL